MAAPSEPLIQPPRKPRDEAALLLTVVAEVEHALMVQYLYAAYSVRYDLENHAHQGAARSLHLRLLQIAREDARRNGLPDHGAEPLASGGCAPQSAA